MFSRIRLFFVGVTTLALMAGTVALSTSVEAAESRIALATNNVYNVAYPNTPAISFRVDASLVDGGQASIIGDGRIWATTTVTNHIGTLRPIDQDTVNSGSAGHLPMGEYQFVVSYGDDTSAPFTVKVGQGVVNIGFTEITDNEDGTANFTYVVKAQWTQTNDNRPAGIVYLQRDGEDTDLVQFGPINQDDPADTPLVFANVPFDVGVEYRLRWAGTENYAEKISAAVIVGGQVPALPTAPVAPAPTFPPATVPATTTTTTTTPPTTTPNTPVRPSEPGTPVTPITAKQGYRIVDADGTVRTYGVQNYGDASRLDLNSPIISASQTASNNGYWLLGADGGIFSFGDAKFFGSMGGEKLNKPVVGLTPTPSGNGYWLVASDGGVFAYGDAGFFGSMGGKPLNKPIVGITAAADGKGYRMVASDGGIFSFGSAAFYGSMGGEPLNKPVVGMTAIPDGNGYWMVASDGGIFSFGNAGFYGSTGNINLNKPIVAMRSTPTGGGYWFVASDGGVFAYGDATFAGSAASEAKASATVALS